MTKKEMEQMLREVQSGSRSVETALEQMQEKVFDLYTSLPLLSRYLGHKHITETEYYLRLLEEHFGGMLAQSDSCHPGLFPKTGGGSGE